MTEKLSVLEFINRCDDMLAIRPVQVTLGKASYTGAEYWQLRHGSTGAPNKSDYIHHAIYLLGERTKSDKRRTRVFTIGAERWYIGSYIDANGYDVLDYDTKTRYHPFGPSVQLMPARHALFTSYQLERAVKTTLNYGAWHVNTLDIVLKDAKNWRGDAIANGVIINGALAHETDIPITNQWLALVPYAGIIEHYQTDYTKHDKLALYKSDPLRFLWCVRTTGTWLCQDNPFRSPLYYAVRHERDHTTFYGYDHGDMVEIAADHVMGWL